MQQITAPPLAPVLAPQQAMVQTPSGPGMYDVPAVALVELHNGPPLTPALSRETPPVPRSEEGLAACRYLLEEARDNASHWWWRCQALSCSIERLSRYASVRYGQRVHDRLGELGALYLDVEWALQRCPQQPDLLRCAQQLKATIVKLGVAGGLCKDDGNLLADASRHAPSADYAFAKKVLKATEIIAVAQNFTSRYAVSQMQQGRAPGRAEQVLGGEKYPGCIPCMIL